MKIATLTKAVLAGVLVLAAYSVWSLSARTTRSNARVLSPEKTLPSGTARPTAAATHIAAPDPYADFRGLNYSNVGLISERDEIRLGSRLHLEVLKKYTPSQFGQNRANQIGQRVANASRRPNMTYHFFVINDRSINAFSGSGGYVYVSSALVKVANDDELAAVLAHEVGHIVARHSLKSIEKSEQMNSIAEWFGSVTGIAGKTAERMGKTAANIVGEGLLAVHTREEEREADYLGVHCAQKAGFQPQGMITMFQKLQRLSKENAGILGSIFDDHPDVQERIENTAYELARSKRETATRR